MTECGLQRHLAAPGRADSHLYGKEESELLDGEDTALCAAGHLCNNRLVLGLIKSMLLCLLEVSRTWEGRE